MYYTFFSCILQVLTVVFDKKNGNKPTPPMAVA
jgi:hypothetical protein